MFENHDRRFSILREIMTQDELRKLPLYSTVKIDFGNPAYQFIGVLVCKWTNPVNINDIEGQVYIEKHNGSDMHTVIWAKISALSVVEAKKSERYEIVDHIVDMLRNYGVI